MKNTEIIELFHSIGNLKKIKRAGWLRHGIPDPETVADHLFRTTFIAMILGDILRLDTAKLMRMALIHDIAEIVTGDITPQNNITNREKQEKEKKAIENLLSALSDIQPYKDLWVEYECQKTPEAIFVRNVDKLEMAIQAIEYERMYPSKDLSEFLTDARKYINHSLIRDLFEEIKNEEGR